LNILICPDSFKGSLTSKEVCEAIERGFLRSGEHFRIEKIPLADGGEGTVEALFLGGGGTLHKALVHGPLGGPVSATFLVLEDGETAVVEMAECAGLPLIPPDKRNPLRTDTYGVGELMLRACELGVQKIIVGVGGSATNDAGTGALKALGIRFLDRHNRELAPGGGSLMHLHRIDTSGLSPLVEEKEIMVATDVRNPLCGNEGAARVYAPQKGAGPREVGILEEGLCRFAVVIEKTTGITITGLPGGGAAGGIAAGFHALLGARIISGIEFVMHALRLEEKIVRADLVVSGEGKVDTQTLSGKVVSGVLSLCAQHKKQVILLAGTVDYKVSRDMSAKILAVLSVVDGPCTLEEAVLRADQLVEETAYQVGHLLAYKENRLDLMD